MPDTALLPQPWTVSARHDEVDGSTTLYLRPPDGASPAVEPGCFHMLWVFGIGEVPISVSGSEDGLGLAHTIRPVGQVTRALCARQVGDLVGVRGPFGRGWPWREAVGRDVLVVAGGIGLAPLRPLLRLLTAERERFGRVSLLYGARHPRDLLYPEERRAWAECIDVLITVDHADPPWDGPVGVVPQLIPHAAFDRRDSVAFCCGPEVMLRFTAVALVEVGLDEARIWLSMERNMQCAVGTCGHCLFGADFICRDGPVLPYRRLAGRLTVAEL